MCADGNIKLLKISSIYGYAYSLCRDHAHTTQSSDATQQFLKSVADTLVEALISIYFYQHVRQHGSWVSACETKAPSLWFVLLSTPSINSTAIPCSLTISLFFSPRIQEATVDLASTGSHCQWSTTAKIVVIAGTVLIGMVVVRHLLRRHH